MSDLKENIPEGYRQTEPRDGFTEEGLVPIKRYGPPSGKQDQFAGERREIFDNLLIGCCTPNEREVEEIISVFLPRIEQLEAALRQIARPVFVTEPAGTPESPWQVALRERIELAQEALGDTP